MGRTHVIRNLNRQIKRRVARELARIKAEGKLDLLCYLVRKGFLSIEQARAEATAMVTAKVIPAAHARADIEHGLTPGFRLPDLAPWPRWPESPSE